MVSEEEWSDIINYLYNSQDSRVLNSLLRSMAEGATDADTQSLAPSETNATGENAGMVSNAPSASQRARSGVASPSAREIRDVEMKKFGYVRTPLQSKKKFKQKLMLFYQDFVKCILDFQLRNHETFLARFIGNFRQVDTNLDGTINQAEFQKLFFSIRFEGKVNGQLSSEELENADETLESLLEVVDPHDSNKITFSSSASCLSRLGGQISRK
jgi:hypothetical protein